MMGMMKPKITRQFCRKCLRSAVPAVTISSPNGRLHFCADHVTEAVKYQR